MLAVELLVVLLFIFLGARIGGIGIGFAGGAGVIALSLILGVPTSQSFIPIDVILNIMSIITAIAAMQVAGGMDWLVQWLCSLRLMQRRFLQRQHSAPV